MAVVGSVIDGKYEVLKQIGKGGMSRVYLAMDRRLNKQWAIKELCRKERDKENEIVVQGLIAEAHLMKKLDHPALPRIVDIIETNQTIFIVMDYIEGETLQTILKKYGAQDQEMVIEWAKQLCSVLYYLHTRNPAIIYRDMKPGNIMVTPNGSIKLIDFGIAREYKKQQIQDTVSLGTKGYAAPEQFGGKGQTDPRTDIYSLGVTLYHLVTGKSPSEPPYQLYPIRYWNPSLSAGFEKIIIKCTQLNPKDRYQNCGELMYALENYEKVDDVYRWRLKKKMMYFSLSACITIFSCVVGIAGQILKTNAENKSYDYLLEKAKSSVEEKQVEKYCESAIDLKPEELQAYYDLIDLYKENASFSVEEQEVLARKLNENLAVLKEQKEYPELAFQIGKLYWYYYDYGTQNAKEDNQLTRMKYSIKWFEDVISLADKEAEYYKIAEIYHQIGVFNRDIVLDMEEAADKGKYQPYFRSLTTLQQELTKEESDIVILEFDRLLLNSIENYGRRFMAEGVSKEDMERCLQQMKESEESIPGDTEKTQKIKAYINERYDEVKKMVELLYAS